MAEPLQYDLRLRLFRGRKSFGPGVAELLHGVEARGSIRAACRDMGMAYSKAWKILKHSEEDLGFALLQREAGGSGGGKAALTPEGRAFLRRYDCFVRRVRAEADAAYAEYFSMYDTGGEGE
ncbi:MAG: LysR family transcriptional regulator [Eubacteriales bacterium]|nr:LysR family transcriptional regulator [Eubacteriales bacterium]